MVLTSETRLFTPACRHAYRAPQAQPASVSSRSCVHDGVERAVRVVGAAVCMRNRRAGGRRSNLHARWIWRAGSDLGQAVERLGVLVHQVDDLVDQIGERHQAAPCRSRPARPRYRSVGRASGSPGSACWNIRASADSPRAGDRAAARCSGRAPRPRWRPRAWGTGIANPEFDRGVTHAGPHVPPDLGAVLDQARARHLLDHPLKFPPARRSTPAGPCAAGCRTRQGDRHLSPMSRPCQNGDDAVRHSRCGRK